MYVVINKAVETARKKAGLLNLFFDEYEIKKRPLDTTKIPMKPKKLIVEDKNISKEPILNKKTLNYLNWHRNYFKKNFI